jgi:membrane protein required for beta-lactamase induction
MENSLKIIRGFLYVLFEVVWFIVVSIPTALMLYTLLNIGELLKSIYKSIKKQSK